MGLIDRIRALRFMYAWRVRHWWMDTDGGRRARVTLFCLSLLLLAWQLVKIAVASLYPPPEYSLLGEPVQAVYWWVVQLIIAIVAAVVAYAMRPKPPQQQERKIESPTVQDGTAVKDYLGTCWIEYDDNFLLAWKIVGRDAIRTKGGKK